MADSTFLNWPFFGDDHRRLAESLRHWTAEHIAPLEEPGQDDDALDAHCRDLVGMLGRSGWLRYCVPQEYGGAGKLEVRNLCLARETLSYVSGLADFAFAMQGLGAVPISLYGSEALKKRYLETIAAGNSIGAFALSETDAGSDVGAIATTATLDGSDYVLNGAKTWISNAGLADCYVIFARTGEAPGTKGLSAFVVDAGSPGLEVTGRIALMAPHPLGTIALDNCRVSAGQMLAGPGDGYRVAMATLDVFRSTVGAAALGFARRALDEAVARSCERQVFGRHLREFQITQAKIADMAVAVDAAALLVYRAAWAKDTSDGGRVTREASMAKLFATEEAQKIIDQALQIFGGLGLVHGNIVESLYRQIRALRIYEGTSEIQKLVIAAEILGEKQGPEPGS